MNTSFYLPTHLTSEQREATPRVHTGSLLLASRIAGPGSGKTEVITWRVAHLVRGDRLCRSSCWSLLLPTRPCMPGESEFEMSNHHVTEDELQEMTRRIVIAAKPLKVTERNDAPCKSA